MKEENKIINIDINSESIEIFRKLGNRTVIHSKINNLPLANFKQKVRDLIKELDTKIDNATMFERYQLNSKIEALKKLLK